MRKLSVMMALACLSSTPLWAKSKKTLPYNLSEEHVPGQLIVGFEKDIAPELKDYVIRRIDNYGGQSSRLRSSPSQTVLLETRGLASDTNQLVAFADYVNSLPGVRFVEANVIYHLFEKLPNDPEFEKLYALKNSKSMDETTRKDIGASYAWEQTTGSKDVLVAVIDTGIDYNHEDLAANYWTNPGESGLDENGEDKRFNGIDDDNNGYVDDWKGWDFANNDNDPMDGHSHGTHCAGTIGAVGDNGVGVVGVNWNVSLVGIKIFSDAGSTSADAIVSGIDYATSIGVDLSSNSWGGSTASQAIKEAIGRANEAGILFVAAAGNSSSNNDVRPNYPSSYDLPNIIGVASTDSDDNRSSFSSYGPSTVHVAAPGSDIYSTEPNNSYGYKSGTSMATPHAAGLFALVMSKFPDANYLEIKDRVLTSADKSGNFLSFVQYGRIDALNALEEDEIAPSAPQNFTVEKVQLQSVELVWEKSGDDGMTGTATAYEVRMNDQPISEENWSKAKRVSTEIKSNKDGKVYAKIKGLALESSGYVSVQAIDNVGNRSSVSESIAFELPAVTSIFTNEGSQSGFQEFKGGWGVDSTSADFPFIADSPNANYKDEVDTSIVSESISLEKKSTIVQMKLRYDLEKSYDFGYGEIKVGDNDWQIFAKFNGTINWQTRNYNVTRFVKNEGAVQLRFRITSDGSINGAGLDIASINVLQAD